MLKKIKVILGSRLYRQGIFVLALYVIGAVIDTIAVYTTYPLIYAMMYPDEFSKNQYTLILSKYIGISDQGELIGVFALFVAFLYFFRNGFAVFQEKIKRSFIKKCQTHTYEKLFSMISHRPYYWFSDTNTSDIQKICVKDINCLIAVLESLIQISASVFSFLFLLVILGITDVKLTLFLLAIVGILTLVINMPITRQMKEYGKVYGWEYSAILKEIQEFVGILKNVLTNRKQDFFQKKFDKHIEEYSNNESKYRFYSVLPGYIMNAVIMTFVFLYIAVLAFQGNDVALQIPTFAMFGMAAMKLLPAATGLVSNYNNILYNTVSIEVLYEQIRLDEMISIRGGDNKYKVKEKLDGNIQVENLSFKYHDAEKNLFTNVSLEIPFNKSVAFIGTTGAGKTTLADIILGLHHPETGKITAGKRDAMKEMNWWAEQIGYIPQNVYLLEDTIRANVALGYESEEISDDVIWECLRQAQMEDFVRSLPDKLDAVTGENGIKISGGQKQRIGIARALYGGAPFLVFDEATSALDNETETVIMEAINNLAGKKTMLIIAHRLTTIEKCEIVYKIEDGAVSRVR